ncbi:MAG: DHH family phosphoesterase, partial [Gemmatimonadetes bacterium]|nr:DHH family phosphoesterase [Gemmatimonadota bacterium]
MSPVTAALLVNRGVTSVEQARAYFSPSVEQLCDPFGLPDMDSAVRLVNRAIDGRQTVLVHGDYDVDGLAATALLTRFLSKLGVNVQYFIPHRIHDHYGLAVRAIERAAGEGASLVIAVDCGIRDYEAVARAGELGMEAIVLDHHEPGDELPCAGAVVDPKLAHSTYPNRELTSAGLALQFARAVARSRDLRDEYVLRAFLDLAAIGTVADVAELLGENRALV